MALARRCAVTLTLAILGCGGRAPVVLEAPNAPSSTADAERAAEAGPRKHPQAEARELYRLSEARFAEEDASGAAGLLEQSIAAMPDDVDPVLRHKLEARLTHMQLTAWQADGDLQHVLSARQRVFTRMASFPDVVAQLTAEQANAMRDDLFEQLADVEGQLEQHLTGNEPSDSELEVLAAAVDARAPERRKPKPETKPRQPRRRRAADGTEIREIDVETRRQSPFDDPEAEARFNSGFASDGFFLTRQPDLVHGPRGLVRVLDASDEQGRGATRRARARVDSQRDALVTCYGAAFARQPIFGLQVDVSMELSGTKVDSAAVTSGTLVDAEGNRCLIEALTATRGTSDAPATQRASMRLLFFFQDAVMLDPATGEFFSPGQPRSKQPEPDPVDVYKFAPMPSF